MNPHSSRVNSKFSFANSTTMAETNSYFGGYDVSSRRNEPRKSKIRKSFVQDLSFSIAPEEMSVLCDTSATVMTSMWGSSPIHGLHKEFQRICTTFSSTYSIFDAIQSFIDECETVIEMSCRSGSVCDKQGNDLSWLVNEKNTWRLIYALYRDRAFFEEDFSAEAPEGEPHPLSEKEIMENFYRMNRSVREAQLVIDWLERNARDEWKLLQREEIAFYTDKTVAWENTLFQLQNSRIPYESSREIVKSLDPDAPRREGRPLHDLDAEDEKRLLRQVFAEIRKGNIDKAQEVCIHCGQSWRAATLDGWRLFHDPNYGFKEKKSKLPIEGNPNRGIWKMCAWKMCEDPRTPPEDKAVMGALCGHLPSILPYCTSWEDLLWAHTKVSVDVAVEQNIRDNSLRDFPPMPAHYWNYERKIEDILRDIGSSEEGRTPIRVIQELLIIGLSSELLSRCAVWVEGLCQPQFLRFLAHVVLVLRMAGHSEPEHLGDDIIKAYIKSMFEDPDSDLIAYYCTKLPAEDQVELYSEYLELVSDPDERKNCLRSAEKFDMKISQITERVVQKIRNKENHNLEGGSELVEELSEDDKKKISALEWMMFYEHQRAEAMWETNAIVRQFIVNKKLTAARLALMEVPPDSPEVVLQHYKCTIDEDEAVRTSKLPAKANSAIKEYLCLKAYVDAHESFSMWFHQFYNTKPKPPMKPPQTKDFTENIAYEHRLKRHNDDMERWRTTMIHQTQRLQKQFNNIIVFPGGWLVDNSADEEPRRSHLERLRSLCIPEICMLLHNVLQSMEMYTEVMNLLVLLMDESTCYYKVFSRQQLKELTTKVKETCHILLKHEGNPFGDQEDSDSVDDQVPVSFTDTDEDASNQYTPCRENFAVKAERLGSQAWNVNLSELLPFNVLPNQDPEYEEEEEEDEQYETAYAKNVEDNLDSDDVFVRIDPELAATYDEFGSRNLKIEGTSKNLGSSFSGSFAM